MPRGLRPAEPDHSSPHQPESDSNGQEAAGVSASSRHLIARGAALVDGDELLDHSDRVLAGNRAQAREDLDLQLAGRERGDGDDVLKVWFVLWTNVADVLAIIRRDPYEQRSPDLDLVASLLPAAVCVVRHDRHVENGAQGRALRGRYHPQGAQAIAVVGSRIGIVVGPVTAREDQQEHRDRDGPGSDLAGDVVIDGHAAVHEPPPSGDGDPAFPIMT